MLKSDLNRDKVTVENKRVVQFVQFSKCSHSSIVWSKINGVSETSKSKWGMCMRNVNHLDGL